MTLAQRLLDIMKEQNITEAALGKMAGVSQQAINKIVKGETQKPRNVISIAAALNVDPIWLASGVGPRQNMLSSQTQTPLPKPEKQASLCIYGARRSFDAHIFHLDKTQIAHKQALPSHLSDKQDLYGFYMQDSAMTPRFKMGDLIIASSLRPPQALEDCVIIHNNSHEDITAFSVLCFSHMTSDHVIAFQHNPQREFSFPITSVNLHRILTMTDFLP